MVAQLFSSSLILSPREQPADCHKALMQVLTAPCIMLLRHGTEPCADLASSHRARPVPGAHVARHSVGPGVYRLHTPSPTHPSHTHVFVQPSSVSCPRNKENILGQEPRRLVVPNDWFSVEGRWKAAICISPNYLPSLGWEYPLEKEIAIHSSILAWRIPWTEEPAGLQSLVLQRVS